MFLYQPTPSELNEKWVTHMLQHVGIEFTEVGHNYLKARMPVDARTQQTFGILHGGASVVLAESVGSIAANLCVAPDRQACVGLDINANHLRTVRSGWVYAHAHPIHLGQSTQVWQIDLTNEDGQAVCASRLTMAVINKAQPVYS
ncbi:MAG: hotdog fold thioesterase [Bacteroidetes bacterium]|jgi:1,4-dihydroxy-2-naphthoyl-CoA hydrolase|nr:hotdog fold thioesterase [Bacteroidota bacterium]